MEPRSIPGMSAHGTASRDHVSATTNPGRVFSRAPARPLPVAVRASGAEIWDETGRRYLDAAGGAIVVGVGHGRDSIGRVIADQAARISYVHGTEFTSEPLEAYAAEVGPLLPLDAPAIYPVSGGSEAMETALKMARAYHLARGEADREVVIGRWGSYHGNSLGALDVSGRRPLRRPYEGWLCRFRHVSAAYPYRAGELEAHALGTAAELAAELERVIILAGPATVAAFVAEPIVGATLGVVAPPDGYWSMISDVCRRHGVLLVLDEVMTGFGRTGRWFGAEHFGVRPDIVIAAKGATSGYWPFGFAAAAGHVYDTIRSRGGFVHGFTFSHSAVGAAVAREVLRILRAEDLVAESARKGARLLSAIRRAFEGHPHAGEIRGMGLFAAIELVEDRESKRPFSRGLQVAERTLAAARGAGLLLYPGTGCANGTDGEIIMVGPPFVVSDGQIDEIAAGLRAAVDAGVAGARATEL
jgi:adenosylmethionine-8-amino-7-oxononanoate aminotransferase